MAVVSSSLFVEVFGQLLRDVNLTGLVSEDDEDLYSVFRARAELMGWSTTSDLRRPVLWEMNEAELAPGTDTCRIGWVQVGLEAGDVEPTGTPTVPIQGYGYAPLGVSRRVVDPPVEPTVVLPPLIQCFDDALRRFGVVELSGIQVTANFLKPRTPSYGDLVEVLNWFNTIPKGRADALITFDQELLGGHTEAELVANLQRKNTGLFEFGPVVAVPEQHSIKPGVEAPGRSLSPALSGLGVSVKLPEWTASAAAWVLAMVVDAAGAIAPDVSNFAVRVVRVR